jgi:hypothetical protein
MQGTLVKLKDAIFCAQIMDTPYISLKKDFPVFKNGEIALSIKENNDKIFVITSAGQAGWISYLVVEPP